MSTGKHLHFKRSYCFRLQPSGPTELGNLTLKINVLGPFETAETVQ
jgi:hypothetical protein